MVKRILLTNDAVNGTLLKIRNFPQPLTHEEKPVLKDFQVLQILEEATNKIFGFKYVTISMIIPIVHGISQYLSTIALSTQSGEALRVGLIQSVQKRLFYHKTKEITRLSP